MHSLIRKISEKQFMWFAVVLFIGSIVPILLLGRYNVMRADDYSYGLEVYDTWIKTGSFWEAVKCAAEHTKKFYFSWQGTYASCFLMSMCPMHFNFECAFVVPLIMIGSLSTAIYLLGQQVFVKWLGMRGKYSYPYIGCMFLFLFWQVLCAPSEGIYWYNGALHYVFMQAFMFLMLTAVSGIIWTDSKRNAVIWCILASLDGLLVGGGNLVTGLQAQIMLILLLLYTFLRNRKKIIYVAIPSFCFTAGFLVNILAPGNMARGSGFGGGYGVIESIMLSFYNAMVYMGEWTSLMVILVWLSVVPVMWCAVRDSQKQFRYPGLVTLGIYCIISAMFTPTLFALGEVGILRINNIIQLVYYFGLFSVTAYWLGWITHRTKYVQKYGVVDGAKDKVRQHGNAIVVVVLAAIVMVWVFTVDKNTYTGISALRSIVKGDAQTFYEEEMERREMFLDDGMSYVIVDVHTARPHLFSDIDLSWDADYWINQSVTHYYHKKKVVRRVE